MNTKKIIDLRPGENLDNRLKVVELLSQSDEYIWIMNWYFSVQHFAILSEVIKNNISITDIRLLCKLNKSIADLETIKEYLKLFLKQYSGINFTIKLITNKKIANSIHDRFYYTKGQAWNFIEFDSLLRNQRATIVMLPEEDLKKNTELEFEKWWNDPNTLDLLSNWDKIKSEVQKNQSNLENEHNSIKRQSKQSQQPKIPTKFYIYKNNKGTTITSDECITVELETATEELKNLDIDNPDNFSYVGFKNALTNESLQFIHITKEDWYAERPILNKMNDSWEGYSYKTYGNLEKMLESIRLFFNDETIDNILPWKITRFSKHMHRDINKDKLHWKDLR